MIKNSTYIREFTTKQKNQLQIIQDTEKIKTVPEILFFSLEKYLEQKKEIERLNRIIEYKQRKIETISNQLDQYKEISSTIINWSEILKNNNL